MADQFVAHLATVPLFAQCSKHELAEIARFVDEIDIEAGRELITEGDVGHEAFVVVEGTASVTRDGQEVTTIGPGAVFGEMALIDRAPRNATVTAATPMKVLVIGKRQFSGLLDESASFRTSIMSALADRVRQKDAQLYG
ncbi:MAG TPA: cyclic nucleotide-binding domain-containing protein [Acidimicrobiales bacterium]|nr:cyclic nucleotide-binding domain-containing protein [Acidimicrobiales bacterium]